MRGADYLQLVHISGMHLSVITQFQYTILA